MDWKANAWSEKCTEKKVFYNWAWGRGWEETSTIMMAEFVCLFVLFKTQLAHCVSLSQIYNTLRRDFIDQSLSWRGSMFSIFVLFERKLLYLEVRGNIVRGGRMFFSLRLVCLNLRSISIWRWEETLFSLSSSCSNLRSWEETSGNQFQIFSISLSFDKNPSATRMPCVGGLIAFNFGETFI